MKHKIQIDCSQQIQELTPIWRSFGYDEINWTYTTRGQEILERISTLADQPYYVRCHHTFTSGNCLSVPTKGSTNICSRSKDGDLQFDFSILDQVFDTFMKHNCKPIVELGFMPDVLSAGPHPKPTYDYQGTDLWRYPPKDYVKWQSLVKKTVKHCVERYGANEVSAWYWEVWNEPDNPGFFRGSVKDYCKIYDFAVAGATEALENIRIGGPALATDGRFLDKFLKHCLEGRNRATGKRGSRLDFVSFHAKGTDWPLKGQLFKMPSLSKISSHLNDYNAVLRKYPAFSKLPCLLDECDMAVATNFGVYDFPEYEINNTAYFPAFIVRMAKAVWDFSAQSNLAIQFFTTWAFYFEGKRFFEGNRALFTNENIRKPVFNAFPLLEKFGSRRVQFEPVLQDGAGNNGIDGIAALTTRDQLTILLWNFDELAEEVKGELSTAALAVSNLTVASKRIKIRHIRIDEKHSNAYTVWRDLGSPQNPSSAEIKKMRAFESLEEGVCFEIDAMNGEAFFEVELQPQSVSLLIIDQV